MAGLYHNVKYLCDLSESYPRGHHVSMWLVDMAAADDPLAGLGFFVRAHHVFVRIRDICRPAPETSPLPIGPMSQADVRKPVRKLKAGCRSNTFWTMNCTWMFFR